MKKKKDEVADCASCKPIILDENLPVMYLVEQYGSIIVAEYGFSAPGIALALEEFWIEDDEKSKYAKKIIIYFSSLKSAINRNK